MFKSLRQSIRFVRSDFPPETSQSVAPAEELPPPVAEPAEELPLPLPFDYPYNPVVRPWENTKAITRLRSIIASGESRYREHLAGILALQTYFERIPVSAPTDSAQPYWENGWFPALDGMSLYWLLASRNPARFIEVGSGNSTKFARQAIRDHGLRTKIVSIDPHPRAEIDLICDDCIRQPCEDVDTAFFEGITAEDILFVDNSHRSFQNSDVTVFFMEILPALPKGTVVGVHDIFLPEDYIAGWEQRFYNEQYLMAAYIFGGMDGGEILLPNWFISKSPELLSILDPVWASPALPGLQNQGGAFWLTR